MDMDTTLFRDSGKRKRFWKGAGRSQGVVEFALAAPILLMLLFAIIDFSLLFSAWLLIQNVSRQALRYGITGQFNPAYCPNTDTTSWYYLQHQAQEDPYHNGLGPCVSGLTDTAANQAEVSEMQDIARIPSIHDEANHYLTGLLLDSSATQSEQGYLNVTVCSGRPLNPDGTGPTKFVTTTGLTGTTTYSECTVRATGEEQEDAGGPGDTMVVLADFNHPFITPFLQLLSIFGGSSTSWTMTHLASADYGVVETFRTSRMMAYNPNGDRYAHENTDRIGNLHSNDHAHAHRYEHSDGNEHGDANTYFHAYFDENKYSDDNEHTDDHENADDNEHSNENEHSDDNENGDANTYYHTYFYENKYSDDNANPDENKYSDDNAYPDANIHFHAYADENKYSDEYQYSNDNKYSDEYQYSNDNTYSDENEHGGTHVDENKHSDDSADIYSYKYGSRRSHQYHWLHVVG
jgi:hypothetical protein